MIFLTLKKLLSMFKLLNLSSLPSSNPGSGHPWLHGSGSVVVGEFTAVDLTGYATEAYASSASNLSSGTLADARLSANVARRDQVNTISGGTVTASDPILQLNQTWNNAAIAFTAFRVDITATQSAILSRLFDYRVGGASQVWAHARYDNSVQGPSLHAGSAFIGTAGGGHAAFGISNSTGNCFAWLNNAGLGIPSGRYIGFGSTNDAMRDPNSAWVDTRMSRGSSSGIVQVGTAANAVGGSVRAASVGNATVTETFDTNQFLFSHRLNVTGKILCSTVVLASGTSCEISGATANTVDIFRNDGVTYGDLRVGRLTTTDDVGIGTSSVVPLGGTYRTIESKGAGGSGYRFSNSLTGGSFTEGYIYAWGQNAIVVGSSSNHPVQIVTAGTSRVVIGTDGSMTVSGWIDAALRPFTVAGLPLASANDGKEYRVTDSTLAMTSANYGSTPSGGGSNKVRLFSNGTAWLLA